MVKYFAVVSRPPAYGIAVLAVVCVLGIVTTGLDPRELDSSLGMILLVHMLLASSGFAPAARLGHFDPRLVRGRGRTAALAAQWCGSVLPGAVAWSVVCLTGLRAGSEAAVSALYGSRLAAFWIVSSLAWSAGFLLPRGAGGGIWIGVLMVLLLRHADLLASAGVEGALRIARGAAMLTLCPFLLLGSHVPVGVPEIFAATGAASLVLLVTWRAGARLDVFLVERS